MAKILLADDSTHAQRMGVKILAAEGHDVSTVSNGQAAIQALEKSAPDLVVADIFMPGRNGYEVCHFVKTDEKLKGIPVLLIIGAMEPYDPDEGRRSGADGLITKPLESSNLLSTVKDLLAASKRFAPARAVPKETVPEKIVIETAGGEIVEEEQKWEDTPEELITPPPPEKLEIPQEMSQQPVGMLTDFMESQTPAAAPPVEIAPATAAPEQPSPGAATSSPEEVSQADEISDPDSLLPDRSTIPQLDIAEKTTWSAEPAPMTPEEEKLFEESSADWSALEQMVEQSAAEPSAPASLPWQNPEPNASEPMPQFMPEMAGPPASMLAGSSHDILLETPPPDLPMGQDALLQTAEQTEAPTATEMELESYENLAETVRAQGPIKTAQAPQPSVGIEAAQEVAASIPAEEAPGGGPPPAWLGPVEELEAAPGERNVPPSEADTPKAPEPAPMDPATLEHIIRGVVGELMPQIIDQVKQALKR